MRRYQLRLFGGVTLTTPGGDDITPGGQKAKALLALLAEAEGLRRGRRWIESRLWSDRAQAQASGSMRQTLSDIRSALGDHADLLQADRTQVWLDADRVETDLDPKGLMRLPHREFLEDIDVRDEAFEDWLRTMRARFDTTTAAPPDGPPRDTGAEPLSTIRIRAMLSDTGSVAERVTSRIVADQVASALQNRLAATRFASKSRRGLASAADLEVRCDAAQDGDRALVFVRVEDGADGRVLYSGHRGFTGPVSEAISDDLIAGLVNSVTKRAVHAVPEFLDPGRPEVQGQALANSGMNHLAEFNPAGFEEAQSLFAEAYEADGNALHLAWRAFVRMAQLVERADGDSQAWLEEVGQLSAHALDRAPENSLVVALVALTRIMLEDDLSEPAMLARHALEAESHSLFARQTLAVAHSAVGNPEAAYALSSSCQPLREDDELSHLWDLYHALVCISAGRFEEARAAAERSLKSAPGFIAPRRQLVALCAHAGDVPTAGRYLEELQLLESDFSLSRLLSDPDYPVLTLRKAGLIDNLGKKLDSDG